MINVFVDFSDKVFEILDSPNYISSSFSSAFGVGAIVWVLDIYLPTSTNFYCVSLSSLS